MNYSMLIDFTVQTAPVKARVHHGVCTVNYFLQAYHSIISPFSHAIFHIHSHTQTYIHHDFFSFI